jgi:DNA-binding NtrC family response regulator
MSQVAGALVDSGRVSAAGSSILIVDDEEPVRRFLSQCLERDGYVVRQAACAAEALGLMMREPATAVLCDIRMPGQDGLWLAERLQAHWPSTAIVMASAVDDLPTIQKCRDLGARDYITKPVQTTQLRDAIRRVVTPTFVEPPRTTPDVQPRETQSGPHAVEAEYTLESSVRSSACGERVLSLNAVRLVRAHVNFTSTLPRRGRVLACPHCSGIVSAELTNF